MAEDLAGAGPPPQSAGLQPDAIGFLDALVIGLNSTSPA